MDALAESLAARSPLIMRLGKDSFYSSLSMGYREALDYLHGQLGVCLDTEDAVEGVTAFLQNATQSGKAAEGRLFLICRIMQEFACRTNRN